MKRFVQMWGWVPVIAALVIAADQWSKAWVRANIPFAGELVPFPTLAAYFRLVNWANNGAAFGILRGQGNLFIAVAVVVIVIVLVYLRQLPADQWPVRLCLALQLGGALGNLIDRIRFGGRVTDFLLFSVPINGRALSWPAFNVADSSIVVGVLRLGYLLIVEEGHRPAKGEQPAEPSQTVADDTH